MVKSKFANIHRYTSHVIASPGEIMKFIWLLSILVIIPSLAIGCTGNSNNAAQADLYFPVQKEPATIVLTSLVSGRLVVDNGYLRVSYRLGGLFPLSRGSMIIWPHGYSWKAENNEIWILDDKGQKVLRVGDSVKLGGGEIPASFAEQLIGQKLPVGIEGPFWLAADIVSD